MKNIALFLCILLIVTACKKETENSPPKAPQESIPSVYLQPPLEQQERPQLLRSQPSTPDKIVPASIDMDSKRKKPPKYPPAAARANIEGTVILIIDVDKYGNITDVNVERSSRNRDLDRAAKDAALHWKYSPAIINGQEISGKVRVPVDFLL